MREAEQFQVPVDGGSLHVGRWDGDGPVVIAAHGITANHTAWSMVADALDRRVTLVAPDLRGRGRSNGLPGPFGMAAHADDLVRVLDHLGVDKALAVGHSMGAFVVASMAVRHPDRVERALLVDGGYTLPIPEGIDVEAALTALIGPAIQRLSMTFPTRAAYTEFWRRHPALVAEWGPAIEAYIQYDLVGEEPELRSSCNPDAILHDGGEGITNPDARDAILRMTVPATLLWCERGMFDDTPGLYTEERLAPLREAQPAMRIEQMVGINHYTASLSEKGARTMADHIVGDA